MTTPDYTSRFDGALARRLGDRIADTTPFDVDAFVARATDGIEPLRMKERVVAFADALHATGGSYRAVLDGIVASLGAVEDPDAGGAWADFDLWPFTMFVRRHGLDDVDASLDALGALTRRFTAEFAIRPYLVHHTDATFARLEAWVDAPCPHQRRLVSEGTRPRLPWGERLRDLQADPSPSIALLDRLVDDPSEYVRRSVANHLNDIAKDHPALAVATAERWRDDDTPHRVRLIRHGMRTLVKGGDPGALAVTGVRADADVHVDAFDASTNVTLGEALTLHARITSREPAPIDVVVDFVIHHVRANGQTSPKVFKWRRRTLAPGETLTLDKGHGIRRITTRRYYPGTHRVDLQVNGAVRASRTFELHVPDA